MDLNPSDADLSGPTVKDSTAPEGLLFQYAENAKPLATPWQVAVERARLVRQCSLEPGVILDPACGSGIQLAAYCAILGRRGMGIELDDSTAHAAAANMLRVVNQGFDSTILDSKIRIGDGTIGDSSLPVAMLHIDPARPRNSRTHGLEEMAPQLPAIFSAWKDNLAQGENGPAILLDLSPRIDENQRSEVESMVEEHWPGIGKTWVWTSRGKGRVDRLSLWAGALSMPGITRRFIRIPPDIKDRALVIEGSAMEEPTAVRRPPRKGESVTILDSALVESGLTQPWFDRVLPEQEITWGIVEGRRPQIHHDSPLDLSGKGDRLLVQATGRIVKLVHCDLDEATIPVLAEAAREYGFGKLTLRIPLSPEDQPKLQGGIDRMLSARGGPRRGFVARKPGDSMLLLCVIDA